MKTAVIYWSATGNTEAMAKAAAQGAGVEAVAVSDFSGGVGEYDTLALGCPAMGDEVLEESEFEPFFASIESELAGKRVLLFGSYGWGDGQWMRDWEKRTKAAGAELVGSEGYIANDAPTDDDIEKLTALGKELA